MKMAARRVRKLTRGGEFEPGRDLCLASITASKSLAVIVESITGSGVDGAIDYERR